ncbi:hypothetical protein M1N20_00645 [Dehalococcoidia bacterium]|nr:hypothetical protein [Dehalococcoidia bacterium]
MKTKHRILSVLTILALVASLSTVMVSPAGAILEPTVALTDYRAGYHSAYEISFLITEPLDTTDRIIITFPPGTGRLPDLGGLEGLEGLAPPIASVKIQGEELDTAIDVVGRMVILDVPDDAVPDEAIPAWTEVKVEFLSPAGITNPRIPGAKTLMVRTTAEPVDVVSAEYIITGFAIHPATAAVGATVTAYGAGFGDDQPIWIFEDDDDNILEPGETVFATTTTDGDGIFSVDITVTAALHGLVDVLDGLPDPTHDEFTFTVAVAPSISLDTPAVPRGGIVQFDGANFKAGAAADIKMRFDAVIDEFKDTGEDLARDKTSFADATIRMPWAAPLGSQRVTAQVRDQKAFATIEVLESFLVLDPALGPLGGVVTASGSGLAPNYLFGVLFGDEILASAETDDDGNVSIPFVVPTDAEVKAHRVSLVADADGDGTVEADETSVTFATFTVLEAKITLLPASDVAGAVVTVSGEGFPAHGTLTELSIGPTDVTPFPRITVAADGTFQVTFTVPDLPIAEYEVKATVGEVDATDDFNVMARPVIVTVEAGFAGIWEQLAYSVWVLRDGKWYEFNLDPAVHARIPEDERLTELRSGEAYWIFVTEDVEAFIGGMTRTLAGGMWHNIGWR